MKNDIIRAVLVFFVLLHLSACSSDTNNESTTPLRLGILPDQGIETLKSRYTPLLDYLNSQTGLNFVFVFPDSYLELEQKFGNKEIDLAYFGGATFVSANKKYNAKPLVMRDVDRRFTSYFLVHRSNKATSIQDFKNKRLAFGSKFSTSGHFMPRYFMSKENIVPEKFFSEVIYTGSHDKTARLVQDNKVEIGVVNSAIVDSMIADGQLASTRVRILKTTPPYPDYVWASQEGLNEKIVVNIRNAFLALSIDNPQHKIVLENISAGAFYPASKEEFNPLVKAMDQITW
ncbi:MAG: phosphate/phosphite/phosphonate ABC transporter substrate-binding protein [Gammaproteobacteria bacterium]|nr:phosphate/phosphite/phosphonate ABC transporter substrate-binding protein [Gammaproteobacteria bacterium]